MQRIVDLDASGVIAEPITVRLRGQEYTLPGDIPAPTYVRLMAVQASADDASVADRAADLYGEILALFQTHHPDMDRLPLGLNELIAAITYIYGGGADAEDPDATDEENPTPAPRKTTRKKAPAKSRS